MIEVRETTVFSRRWSFCCAAATRARRTGISGRPNRWHAIWRN